MNGKPPKNQKRSFLSAIGNKTRSAGAALGRFWSEKRAGGGPLGSRLTRRAALVTAGGAVLVFAGTFTTGQICLAAERRTKSASLPFPFKLSEIFAIGTARAATVPAGLAAERLDRALLRGAMPDGDLAAAARRRIEEDLESGRCVVAGRWVVSETEADLCAVVASRLS